MCVNTPLPPLPNPPCVSRQVLKEHERGPMVKAGGVGLRTNVAHRDVEGGVAEMLPLRREVLHMDPVLRRYYDHLAAEAESCVVAAVK